MRSFAVRMLATRLHRWIGLALGAWFTLLGLTGSVLVWQEDLDAALNPEWFAARPACGALQSGVPAVEATLQALARERPQVVPTMVVAPRVPGAAHAIWERAGAARRQHFVDAVCGDYLGWRTWGEFRLDRAHAIPALYELHRSLLSGEIGHIAVGLAGLAMLGVLLTGAVVAWPRAAMRESWRRALSATLDAPPMRRWYGLHRAGGLWLLPYLLLMCLTGAYLCFPAQGRALVAAILPTTGPMTAAAATNTDASAIAPDAALAMAGARWSDAQWSRLTLPTAAAPQYEVRLLQAREPRKDTGDTRVRVARDGGAMQVRDPLRAPAGDTLLAWLFPLHSGEALGLPGRIAWMLLGLSPAAFFATGLWLWLRRRRLRAGRALSAASASPVARPDR